MHRFFVDADVISGADATLAGDQARQIATVLRMAPGDQVTLVRDGEELVIALRDVTPARVSGAVLSRAPSAAEPRVAITLALPLLRGDRSEEVVEAVAQLGVVRIVPYTSSRSVVRALNDARRSRWVRIARESAETARRGRIPEITALADWHGLLAQLDAPVVVPWEEERSLLLRDAVRGTECLSLVIGPEGGISPEEIAQARAAGAMTVSLGRRSLRAETAAIAAVAQVFALLDP